MVPGAATRNRLRQVFLQRRGAGDSGHSLAASFHDLRVYHQLTFTGKKTMRFSIEVLGKEYEGVIGKCVAVSHCLKCAFGSWPVCPACDVCRQFSQELEDAGKRNLGVYFREKK